MGELERRGRAWAVVGVAERQHGVLRHDQLLALGFDKSAIHRWLLDGRLHRRHRGVYTLGHTLLRQEGEWCAALWAVPGGVLSHQSAAAVHGWIGADPTVQHVSTINAAHARPGLVVHRVKVLTTLDVERAPLLAVTTPARTIVDLASLLPWPELRAIADRIRDLDVPAVRAALGRVGHRRGATNVRRLCRRLEAHTKSEFERRYLRFCRHHRIPLPDGVNGRVAGFTVDCRYDARRIVVELDGRAFHARQDQMRADRRRDRKTLIAGYPAVRFVWEDFDDDAAAETARDLRRLLVP